MIAITDGFQRSFNYLRLSVTDQCNFKCTYCLPNGFQSSLTEPPLTVAEIARLARAFAEMGFWKIRVTGGEPTVRPDILEIIRTLADTPGVSQIPLSTNGYRLKNLATNLRQAGATGLNVSIDTLDRQAFLAITGQDRLNDILEGIESALELGFSSIKINCVLMKTRNAQIWKDFSEWIRARPICVRFIELMRTGDNVDLFDREHLSGAALEKQFIAGGWVAKPRVAGAGPAREFVHSDYHGTLGLITPYARDFCHSCNRLRVQSRGGLQLCLFGEGGYSLRPFLQADSQRTALQEKVRALIGNKAASHSLAEGNSGATRHFAATGG